MLLRFGWSARRFGQGGFLAKAGLGAKIEKANKDLAEVKYDFKNILHRSHIQAN